MDKMLRKLGFTLTIEAVGGEPKEFWQKGNYWFSACGINTYQLVGGPRDINVKFTTNKRIRKRQDKEIIEKLTKFLATEVRNQEEE